MLLSTSQYAAPGQIVIGEDMQWDEARAFCQQKTGGDLLTVKDQATYDRLATLTQGYTNPVLIGLMSDSAGNWEWADGSFMDLDFLRAHSADQLEGVGENQVIPVPLSWILAVARALTKTRQGVFYPPSYAQDPNAGFHVSRTTTLLSFCLALFRKHRRLCWQDWNNRNDQSTSGGHPAGRMAFACSSAGESRGARGASPAPPPGGGH